MALNVKDSSNTVQVLKTDLDGNGQHIAHHIVDSSSLPTGAAADYSLQTLITAVGELATLAETQPVALTATGGLTVLGNILTAIAAQATLAQTQPISAASLPLPTGAAADASLQELLNTESSQIPTVAGPFIDTATHQIVAAPGSGTLIITHVVVANSSSTGTLVTLQNGSGGTALITVYVPPTSNSAHFAWPANTGLRLSATTGLYAQCGTNSSSVTVSVGSYVTLT
jgi:hypothetical protein